MSGWTLDALDLPDVELSGSEDEAKVVQNELDDDEDEKILNIDDEGYFDEEDRRKLMALNELERESILFERKQKQKEQKDRAKALSRLNKTQDKSATAAKSDKSAAAKKQRKTSLGASASSGKEAALASIRERKRNRALTKRSEEIGSESEEEYADEFEETPAKKVTSKKGKFSKDESDDEIFSEEEDDGRVDEKKKVTKSVVTSKTPLTLKNLIGMQIRRFNLEQMHSEGWFDKFVTGMFVRLFAGKSQSGKDLYFVTEIVDVVDYKKKYQFGKVPTKRALLLRHPTFPDRAWKMSDISNASFTQEEMNVWLNNMKKAKEDSLTAEEAAQRVLEAHAYRKAYKHTPEEIERLLKQRKEVDDNPANLTKEIIEVEYEMQRTMREGNQEEAKRLSYRLDALREQEELLRRRAGAQEKHQFTGLSGAQKVSGINNVRKANASSPTRQSGVEDSVFSPELVSTFEVKDSELPETMRSGLMKDVYVSKEMRILAGINNVPLHIDLKKTSSTIPRKYPMVFGNRMPILPYPQYPKELTKNRPGGSLLIEEYISKLQQSQQQAQQQPPRRR